MASKVIWKSGDLVNIKLRDDLYTTGQILTSPAMRFYDISNHDGIWSDIDLNAEKVLFRVFVGNIVNQFLVKEKIKITSIIPSNKPYYPYWIKPYTLTMDSEHYKGDRFSFPFLGGKIIDLGPDGDISTTQATVIQEDLTVTEDRKLIEEYELTNMWGHEDLSDRLCRYFNTGINRDDLSLKFSLIYGMTERSYVH
ncbi:hypothetical protein [Edaphovirga cremea]|uniref:hypothetical protein n=1 Tax=Edaphovirga cremea TaxID=2267246 RepID=UPI0014744D92|nr:hypothetical protein [Edaphovirga cremea]